MTKGAALAEFLTDEARALLDFVFDGVYVVDRDRRIVFWNRGAERMTGYAAAEVEGRSCGDFILNHIGENGDPLCVAGCPLQRAMEERRRVEMKVFPTHRSGLRFAVSTHVAPIEDAHGNVIGGVEIFRDVSTEDRLQELQRKFDDLIRRYVSKSTYESVKGAAAAEEETVATERDLTVLFMDVVGFTSISERISAPEIVRMLNHLFSTASRVIERRSGDIDKFIGDCVMAIFVSADDAVAAAAEILGPGLEGLRRVLEEDGLPEVRVRIGLSSGLLVHGDIGSENRKDMTVIGDVVNTASRVEHAAKPGTFLISEATYARLSAPQAFEFDQEIALKGKAAPVRLYRPSTSPTR